MNSLDPNSYESLESDKPKRPSESPFLDEELFADMETGTVGARPSHLVGYQIESPFQYAFELEQESFLEPEVDEPEAELYKEKSRLEAYDVDEVLDDELSEDEEAITGGEFEDEWYDEKSDEEIDKEIEEGLTEVLADEEEKLNESEYGHEFLEFVGEDEGDLALEAFRPSGMDEGILEEEFWEAQLGGGRPRDFKLELELNYGMERAVGGAPEGFPFIPSGSRLPDDTVVTAHTKASDGFQVVMDGPRMEIETRRIGLEEPAELDRIMTNILGFVSDLRNSAKNQRPRTVPASARAGKVRDFHLPVFADPDFLAFPIKDSKKQRTWFRQNYGVGASPQCTIDVPLESVIDFVDELRRSQRRSRSRRWTGSSGSRAGLRSDALYHARDTVLKSFRAHSAAGRATNRQLTRKLAGFMILLVQYLRTSEMRYHKPDQPSNVTFTKPDSGSNDHEQFPKAYIPLVVHTHFHVMFHNILSSSERTLFLSLYGDTSVRQNLFDLALDRPGSKSGSAELFPARTRGIQTRDFGSFLTWDQLVDSAIDLTKPIKDAAGNISLPTPLAKASKGVAKTGPAALRVDGVRLEMRRMGYRWWMPNEWRSMSRSLYKMARKLNLIP